MTFAIGIENGKYRENIAQLWRTAYQFGASYIFTINSHYTWHPCDTYKTARQIPLFQYESLEKLTIPDGWDLIVIEQGGKDVKTFTHPKRALYVMGNEDEGISQDLYMLADDIISINSPRQNSFNVSVAGAIIMYDRCKKS
jgi:tRNA G18 (ribose-2'-O)-methylase SpoU